MKVAVVGGGSRIIPRALCDEWLAKCSFITGQNMLSTSGPTPTFWNQTMGGFGLFAFSLFTWKMVWICSTDFYDKGY